MIRVLVADDYSDRSVIGAYPLLPRGNSCRLEFYAKSTAPALVLPGLRKDRQEGAKEINLNRQTGTVPMLWLRVPQFLP